jgi:hypothetical protein
MIETLVQDINAFVLKNHTDTALFGGGIGDLVKDGYVRQLKKRDKVRDAKTLYFSELGDTCPRRMWFKYHKPNIGEALRSETKIKFIYGDMLEALVLQLARDSGHSVEREQEVVEYVDDATGWRVRGRIDAVIDGHVVDVKSVTKQSERKFHDGLVDDPFGYYGQLNGYANVLKSKEMGFLTIQKELGHINYFPFGSDDKVFNHTVNRAIKSVDRDTPIDDVLSPVAQSATSKNKKLCTTCSYCPFKRECFPALRAFAYSNKVEFLTEVVDVPRVPEIDLNKVENENA